MRDRMWILSTDGPQLVEPTPLERSTIGLYWNAVQEFLGTGQTGLLGTFAGVHVAGFEIETDPDAVEEWWRRGELNFLEIYES